MEALIEAIVQKLHLLPEVKVLEVLNFVDFLVCNKENPTLRQLENNLLREDEEFEAIADQLADEFQRHIGASTLVLSDYAVSRAGIYEEHP